MTALKKRPVAILIAVVIIVLSTLFSAHRSLNNRCGQMEDLFYDTVGPYLSNCADAANGMFTVACNYPELEAETTALRTARNALLDADDIENKYTAYMSLRTAVADLSDAMAETELTDSAQRNFSGYMGSFQTAVNGIAASDYNQDVREFTHKTLEVFPANLLSGLLNTEAPALFE